MKMLTIPALLAAVAVTPAHAWTTESITITGGSMTLHDPNIGSFGTVPVLPGAANTLDDGVVNGAVDADGLHGSPASPVTTFMFLGTPWNTYFAHSATTCNWNCSAMITLNDPSPGPVTIAGTAWDPMITADFSGFFTEWNGNYIWQGGQATGTGSWIVPPVPGATTGLYNFTLQWSVRHDQGPFMGMTSDWVLTGTAVAVVPEPETYALMLAGLGLVGWAVRHRCRR